MSLNVVTVAQKRKTYSDRTGATGRGAKILAKAMTEKPEFAENANGDLVRVWKKEDLQRFTHDDIAAALLGLRVIEEDDMIERVPGTAVKYAVTNGWLMRDPKIASILWVTVKGAAALKLPATVRGRTIKFVKP